MTGHDPDDSGDAPDDPRDAPDETGTPSKTGDDAPHTGDDNGGTGDDAHDKGDGARDTDDDVTAGETGDRPGNWPDDWTTANDDAHAPRMDDHSTADEDDYSTATEDDRAITGDDHDRVADADSTGKADPTGTADASGNPDDPADSTLGERASPEKPPAPNVDDDAPTIADDGPVTWFMNTNNALVVVVRDVVSSVAAVAAVGLVLFAISGIWPPLVAVESGSMEPHMSKGDLVFLVDENRFVPQSAIDDTGVSTYHAARDANGYSKFGNYGDVVVYRPYGDTGRTPIIHRARFHVEEGENWIDDANPDYLGTVDSCSEVPRDMCPAPYDGFVTKGDANPTYDQIGDQSNIVKDDWIRGKAEVRIPLLGWIRLEFAKLAAASPTAVGSFGALATRLGALGFAVGAAVLSTRA